MGPGGNFVIPDRNFVIPDRKGLTVAPGSNR
jgi:hypothetical protein